MKQKRIGKKEIEYLADLANIGLTEKEIEKYEKDLSSVLSYMEKLGEVDVEGVEPVSNVTGIVNETKDDEVKPSIAKRGDLLDLASKKEGDFIKTKPPIE